MSRFTVWMITAAASGFLAAAGVVVGLRLANAQAPGAPPAPECAAQTQRMQEESARLRRLVQLYRQREAAYRQRLQEAQEALGQAAGARGGARRDRPEREGRRSHEEWDDDD